MPTSGMRNPAPRTSPVTYRPTFPQETPRVGSVRIINARSANGVLAAVNVLTLGYRDEITYSTEDAKHAIAGYAFATRPLRWSPARGMTPRGGAPAGEQRRWAYRTFDCLQCPPGPWTDWELLASTGLNAPPSATVISALLDIRDEVWAALSRVPSLLAFDELDHADVTAAEEGSPLWNLLRARWLLYGVNGLGVAGVHKLLHHKRPQFCPLVDRQTLPLLKGRSWSGEQIHHDLCRNAAGFRELELWFAELAAARGPENVALSRLRLHDILVWLHASAGGGGARQRIEAVDRGRKLLGGQT